MFEILLWLSFAANSIMTGLVLFVHFVHYPAFKFVPIDRAKEFHNFHTARTGYIVIIPMLMELFSGLLMIFFAPTISTMVISIMLGLLVLLIWYETFFRVIPIHEKIASEGVNCNSIVTKLVEANRVRTNYWVLRFILLTYLVFVLIII